MSISKVSKKGLVNIPVIVRNALGIEEGDILVWEVTEDKKAAVVKVIKNPERYLKGKYRDPDMVYNKVEEVADKLLVRELNASNRVRHADSSR